MIKAFEILLSAHGACSFAESNPLQRMWRDSSTAARHVPIDEVYGKALLGRKDQVAPLI